VVAEVLFAIKYRLSGRESQFQLVLLLHGPPLRVLEMRRPAVGGTASERHPVIRALLDDISCTGVIPRRRLVSTFRSEDLQFLPVFEHYLPIPMLVVLTVPEDEHFPDVDD
jgi:hypothetical protein